MMFRNQTLEAEANSFGSLGVVKKNVEIMRSFSSFSLFASSETRSTRYDSQVDSITHDSGEKKRKNLLHMMKIFEEEKLIS